jgi:hypothetical protein
MSTDPIKQAIADMVATRIRGEEPYRYPDLPVDRIEITRTDNLNSQVRVVTQGQGVRYFTVKVSEAL